MIKKKKKKYKKIYIWEETRTKEAKWVVHTDVFAQTQKSLYASNDAPPNPSDAVASSALPCTVGVAPYLCLLTQLFSHHNIF
jgi:hypothetical protein